MRNGLPYYKAYPRDFIEGTIGMPFEVKCAYRVVLDLIYMQSGELPDDPRYISGLLGCSVRKWKSIRDQLVEMDKIQVSGEFLTNYRAEKELEILAKHQDKQRENRRRPNKNNNLEKPRFDHTESEPDKEASASLAREDFSSSKKSPDDETRREKLLRAVGADPVSGMIGPNGAVLGKPFDMTIADGWKELGISTDRQCEILADRCSANRKKNPHWNPGSFKYFDAMMREAAASGKHVRPMSFTERYLAKQRGEKIPGESSESSPLVRKILSQIEAGTYQ